MITGCAKLDYKMDYLVVRKKEMINRIYIGEIDLLIIDSTSISITTMLLCELQKQKVKIMFCDEKHNPHSEMVACYGSYDNSIKIKQQLSWSEDIKFQVWTCIVKEKIKKQAEHLHLRGCDKQKEMLYDYMNNVEYKDATNREGHAAKVYFNAIFGMEFSRNDTNPINAALDYGYGILLACFNREIVSSGYLTQLGIFHDNMFNHFNLSSDFMEPFRILVDIRTFDIAPVKFEHDEKMSMLSMLNEEICIDGKIHTVNNAIKIYCKSIFEALNEKDTSKIKFYRNEL